MTDRDDAEWFDFGPPPYQAKVKAGITPDDVRDCQADFADDFGDFDAQLAIEVWVLPSLDGRIIGFKFTRTTGEVVKLAVPAALIDQVVGQIFLAWEIAHDTKAAAQTGGKH